MILRPLSFIISSFLLGITLVNIQRTIVYMVLLFLLLFILIHKKSLKNYHTYNSLIEKNVYIKYKKTKIIIIMISFFIFGILYTNFYNLIKSTHFTNYIGQEVKINGVVTETGEAYIIKNIFINNKKVPGKAIVYSNNTYSVTDEISGFAALELPPVASNFNGFNYRQYLLSKNIYITLTLTDSTSPIGNKLNFIEETSLKIRAHIKNILQENYPPKESSILNAILIGYDSLITEDLEASYKNSGLIHLLVVSGAHVAFMLLIFSYILKLLKIPPNIKNLILIFIIIIYIYLTGATESVLRAGIATIIIIISQIISRKNDSITTIFLTAFILCIYNPFIIYSIGFKLSFAGALGIILLNEPLKKILYPLPSTLQSAISVTISASIATYPILAYYFNTINFSGLIANLPALPLVEFIMAFGMLSILPIIGKFFVPCEYILICLLNYIAEIFSNLPLLNYTVITPNIFTIVLYYIFIFYIINKKPSRLLIISFTIIFTLTIFAPKIYPQKLEINFLDVSHGDSIFIITPNKKTILIDTGDSYIYNDKTYDIAKSTIVPFILDSGYKTIDLLILSHTDSDHIGGVPHIVNTLNVKQVIIGKNSINNPEFLTLKKLFLEKHIPILELKYGDDFCIGEINFNTLAPFETLISTENNNSLVLKMNYKNITTLFTGDSEKESEQLILKNNSNIKSDILKVAHHGSNTSSTKEFIDEVSPKISIISVGERFSALPSTNVLENLKNSKIFITSKTGGVKIIIDNNQNIYIKTCY